MRHICLCSGRSKVVASALMQARHQISHQQLLDAVSPEKRAAYRKSTGI